METIDRYISPWYLKMTRNKMIPVIVLCVICTLYQLTESIIIINRNESVSLTNKVNTIKDL